MIIEWGKNDVGITRLFGIKSGKFFTADDPYGKRHIFLKLEPALAIEFISGAEWDCVVSTSIGEHKFTNVQYVDAVLTVKSAVDKYARNEHEGEE